MNPDEYRVFHPKYDEIQQQYGDEASKHTGLFSGKWLILSKIKR